MFKKLITLLGATLLLSGCSWNTVDRSKTTTWFDSSNTNNGQSATVEVERIAPVESTIKLKVEEVKVLRYDIYPRNATTNISIDISGLGVSANVYVDEDNDICVYGRRVGNGIVRLVTDNHKYAEYTIIVTEPDPQTNTSIFDDEETNGLAAVDKLNKYFNEKIAEDYEGVHTQYLIDSDYFGWYLDCYISYANTSVEYLGSVLEQFMGYFPDYMFKYSEAYRDTSSSPLDAQYTLVLVNSNISLAATLCSYVLNDETRIEVLIYDSWQNGGLYY